MSGNNNARSSKAVSSASLHANLQAEQASQKSSGMVGPDSILGSARASAAAAIGNILGGPPGFPPQQMAQNLKKQAETLEDACKQVLVQMKYTVLDPQYSETNLSGIQMHV